MQRISNSFSCKTIKEKGFLNAQVEESICLKYPDNFCLFLLLLTVTKLWQSCPNSCSQRKVDMDAPSGIPTVSGFASKSTRGGGAGCQSEHTTLHKMLQNTHYEWPFCRYTIKAYKIKIKKSFCISKSLLDMTKINTKIFINMLTWQYSVVFTF